MINEALRSWTTKYVIVFFFSKMPGLFANSAQFHPGHNQNYWAKLTFREKVKHVFVVGIPQIASLINRKNYPKNIIYCRYNNALLVVVIWTYNIPTCASYKHNIYSFPHINYSRNICHSTLPWVLMSALKKKWAIQLLLPIEIISY